MQMIVGRLFMVVLMICGPMMTWSGYQAGKQNQLIAKEGRETVGSILEAELQRGRKGRRDYHFTVRYQIPGDDAVTKEFSVTRAAFDRHISEDAIAVTEIPLVYLPSDHTVVRLKDASVDDSIVMYLGMIATLGGWLWALGMLTGLITPE